MSKIIKFPNRLTDQNEAKEVDCRQFDRERSEAHRRYALGGGLFLWNVAKVLLMVVRMPLFLMLYFLRAPVIVLCSMLYLPLFLLALFAWYGFPEKPQMWGSCGVISLVSFMLMYVYDLVLSWLSPHELVRTL